MRTAIVLACFASLAGVRTFGQVGNGTITGTVTDMAGAVVAGAKVDAKNVETGVVYSSTSTGAGNYTIADLPVGTYTITTSVTGFKTYSHTNLQMAAAATLREDIALQVGGATESVTVTAESTLLKTETGDVSSNITVREIDELPLMGIGATQSGTSGYRNPYDVVDMLPGVVNYNAANDIGLNVNGLTTQSMLVDGQEATTRVLGIGGTGQYYQIGQMGVDAIQEVSYQTSNYAPEYGTASSVVINQTMKSGTNTWHGSGYDYVVNEDLNAGEPFSISGCIQGLIPGTSQCSGLGGSEGKYQPRQRRQDFGGTLGGPVFIPKIYNGHNKTFFYFSYEQYAETDFYTFSDTVATPAYIGGDFSAISPNGTCSLCSAYGIQQSGLGVPTPEKDPLGALMFANEIYDPATRGVTAAGLGYASPFPNNMIPPTRFSPLTVKLQNLISSLGVSSQGTSLTGNYSAHIPGVRYSAIPSIKIDHTLSEKDKLSFFYSENNTVGQISSPLGNADGLPTEIGAYRGTFIPTWTYRLNYDRTLSPTLLLHIGGGYIRTTFSDRAPFLKFQPSQFGLVGMIQARQFPTFTGMESLNSALAPLYGGMQPIGTALQAQSYDVEGKQTYTTSLTWVKEAHTFKFGANLTMEGVTAGPISGMTFTTGIGPTSEPFAPTESFNGFTTGFGYASWLLGDYASTAQTATIDPREQVADWSLYAQDSWKVTRKLTLDYGLRWDLYGVEREEYGRWGQFSETTPNANAGGHPGSTIFASNCNCQFYQPVYPYAIGPRLGVAYQIDPKTVFRGGWGLTYALTENAAGSTVATNGAYPVAANSPSYVPSANCGGSATTSCQFVNDQTPGWIVPPVWPVSTNVYPTLGTLSPTPTMPDPNQNRPPRVNQWSVGFQREITRSFIIDASYVANRAAWLSQSCITGCNGNGGFTHVSAQTYAQWGLWPFPGTGPCQSGAAGLGTVCETSSYVDAPAGVSCQSGNDCDRALLSLPISSAVVQQHMAAYGITSLIPYTGFPTSTALSGVVGRPFPQYGAIGAGSTPTGDSHYDSLQIKGTKRFSHGLQASGYFTWAQGFNRAVRQDYFNPASNEWSLMQIPPRTLSFNFIYTVPRPGFIHNKMLNNIARDWQVGGFALYQSGAFLAIPGTPNAEFLTTQDEYVKGQPLYTPGVNLNNLGSYNPFTTQVLNPAAWAACPVNTNCGDSGNDFLKNFRGPRTPRENANIGRNFRIRERWNFQVRAEFTNIFNRTLMPAPSTTAPQNPVTRNGLGILTSGFGVIDAFQAPNTANIFDGTTAASTLAARQGTIIARFSF
jgi:hypothetical protein